MSDRQCRLMRRVTADSDDDDDDDVLVSLRGHG